MPSVSPNTSSPDTPSSDTFSPDRALAAPSVVFATPHGALRWADDNDRLYLTIGAHTHPVSAEAVRGLRRSMGNLAHDVYRCDRACRWQVRMPDGTVRVLDSTDVLRLHTLLDGAVAMLDLDAILVDANIEWADAT